MDEQRKASIKDVHSFWDFWSSSNTKKAIAITLVVFAFGTSLSYFVIFPNQTVRKDEITVNSNGPTTKTTTVTTIPHDIPVAYFVVPGLAILILLVPMLKKAKLGPLELGLEESAPGNKIPNQFKNRDRC